MFPFTVRMPAPVFKTSYSAVKWAALLFMTYDHVLKYIFFIQPGAPVLFPGRFAFPLFAFMIADHLQKRGHFEKYLTRLYFFAVLTMMVRLGFGRPLPFNIMFTFLLSVLLLFCFEKTVLLPKVGKILARLLTGVFILNGALFVEFGVWGVLLTPMIYFFLKDRNVLKGVGVLLLLFLMMPADFLYRAGIVVFGLFLLLLEPVSKQPPPSFKRTGWLFYAYYPVHLLIVYLIGEGIKSGWLLN